MRANLLNYLVHQAGWVAAVAGAASGAAWTGAAAALTLVGLHLVLARSGRAEATLVLAAAGVGVLVDSLQVALGLLRFPSGSVSEWLCPPWIVVMWMLFAITFRFSLRWLLARLDRAAIAGAAGGPLAYSVGERLGAVELAEPRLPTLAVMAGVWLIALPVLAHLARRGAPGAYRLPLVGCVPASPPGPGDSEP
jgi:hypothetical protein